MRSTIQLAVYVPILLVAMLLVANPDGFVRSAIGALDVRFLTGWRLTRHWESIVDSAIRFDAGEAPVEVVVFVDYTCSYCRMLNDTIVKTYETGTHSGIAYRFFPRASLSFSMGAARLALCAAHQGQFNDVHTHLLSTSTWIETEDWVGVGDAAGIRNKTALAECIQSDDTIQRINEDLQLAERLRLTATPAIITRGHVAYGVVPVVHLRRLLRAHESGAQDSALTIDTTTLTRLP